MTKHSCVTASALIFVLSTGDRIHAAEFIPLGDFPGGAFSSSAVAISDDGTSVLGLGIYDDSGHIAAFRWKDGDGLHALVEFARDIMPGGVSNDGMIVVGHERVSPPVAENAFVWKVAQGISLLPGFPSNVYSRAEDVSSNGTFVVGGTAAGVIGAFPEAFLWTENSGPIGLGDLPGGQDFSNAIGVSANGKAVAGYSGSLSDHRIEAFHWTKASGMVGLGDLSGGDYSSYARNISADGRVVVGFSETSPLTSQAFRWSSATGMIGLGTIPGYENFSVASATNRDGTVVVGTAADDSGVGVSFVWDAVHGLRLLEQVLVEEIGLATELSGWTLESATDISADGLSIIGHGRNPNGDLEAYLVRLDRPLTAPEPASIALFGVAFAVFLVSRRSRR